MLHHLNSWAISLRFSDLIVFSNAPRIDFRFLQKNTKIYILEVQFLLLTRIFGLMNCTSLELSLCR